MNKKNSNKLLSQLLHGYVLNFIRLYFSAKITYDHAVTSVNGKIKTVEYTVVVIQYTDGSSSTYRSFIFMFTEVNYKYTQ